MFSIAKQRFATGVSLASLHISLQTDYFKGKSICGRKCLRFFAVLQIFLPAKYSLSYNPGQNIVDILRILQIFSGRHKQSKPFQVHEKSRSRLTLLYIIQIDDLRLRILGLLRIQPKVPVLSSLVPRLLAPNRNLVKSCFWAKIQSFEFQKLLQICTDFGKNLQYFWPGWQI